MKKTKKRKKPEGKVKSFLGKRRQKVEKQNKADNIFTSKRCRELKWAKISLYEYYYPPYCKRKTIGIKWRKIFSKIY